MREHLEIPEQDPISSPVRLRESEDTAVEPLAVGGIYKVAIGVHCDTLLPRDVMQCTPHFRDATGVASPATVCTQIAALMGTFLQQTAQGTVKVYMEDFNPTNPHNPLATADFGTPGQVLNSYGPREIALVCSYYAGQNVKRYRGRMYVPLTWQRTAGGGALANPGVRPVPSHMSAALSFGATELKGPRSNGWHWCVASTVDKVGRDVTDYWVDDEWDIIRSRGLKGTDRQVATIP
jgi:hypothetical protein